MTRVLRVIGVVPLPRNWRRSMIGSSWPRTLASPLIQGLAPGTRVMPAGTPNTSRVSSRATSGAFLGHLRRHRPPATLQLRQELERPIPERPECDFDFLTHVGAARLTAKESPEPWQRAGRARPA